jgi:hypothetical protein
VITSSAATERFASSQTATRSLDEITAILDVDSATVVRDLESVAQRFAASSFDASRRQPTRAASDAILSDSRGAPSAASVLRQPPCLSVQGSSAAVRPLTFCLSEEYWS